ncbi:MAG: hypothetical protein JXM69_09410 [Anaerolineae bacterium]|nr:hypothetical protein [Anaerolineae bacterium]
MPTKKSKSRSPVKLPSATRGGYVKFSDKLTDSLQDITSMINEHKEMIDTIQEIGIQLTDTFGILHTLTVKYAGTVNSVLDILLPLLKNIPLVPPKLLDLATTMERITQQIIDDSPNTSKAIKDINVGLKTGDVNRLRGHSGELQQVSRTLTSILPQ